MKLGLIFSCALLTSVWLLAACSGPLGPIAGGELRGVAADVPASWAGVDSVEHVQLETINNGKPRSVLIWVGTADDRLYIATSLISGSNDPASRTWVKNVTDNPNVRLLAREQIYRLRAVRVMDPARLAAAKSVMMSKYEVVADSQSSGAWVYELQAR